MAIAIKRDLPTKLKLENALIAFSRARTMTAVPIFARTRAAWADTTTPHGRLMLTMLGGLAEFERELIRARTDAF
jgi:hypothetical protein